MLDFMRHLIDSGFIPFILSSTNNNTPQHGRLNMIRIIEILIAAVIIVYANNKMQEVKQENLKENVRVAIANMKDTSNRIEQRVNALNEKMDSWYEHMNDKLETVQSNRYSFMPPRKNK
jgi:hypothetical protein